MQDHTARITTLTALCAFWAALFAPSHVTSLQFGHNRIRSDFYGKDSSATQSAAIPKSECAISSRRNILTTAASGLAWMACVGGALPAKAATATETTSIETNEITATKKSNFNYDLGSSDCETSCVLNCELQKNGKNGGKSSEGCLDSCVRSGQRYCHQVASTSDSPSASEAPTSRYITTTKEPRIQSTKPIPGLKYNSNRGGAWRD